jgi:hypothetical protein
VVIALVVNVDFFAWDAKVYSNVKWGAFIFVSRWGFDHHVTGSDAVEHFFELLDVFANSGFYGRGWVHMTKCDL